MCLQLPFHGRLCPKADGINPQRSAKNMLPTTPVTHGELCGACVNAEMPINKSHKLLYPVAASKDGPPYHSVELRSRAASASPELNTHQSVADSLHHNVIGQVGQPFDVFEAMSGWPEGSLIRLSGRKVRGVTAARQMNGSWSD